MLCVYLCEDRNLAELCQCQNSGAQAPPEFVPPQHRQEAPAQPTDTLTVCHPLLTVQEVPADPGWILLGAQGCLNALDEVAEVV